MSSGVGQRYGSDPRLLWRRLMATAPIRTLAWEPPYAMGVALEETKRNKTKLEANDKDTTIQKPTGCSRSSFKREIYRNASLAQETRKISKKQPTLYTESY